MSNRRPALRVTGTDEDVIDRFGAIMPWGTVYGSYRQDAKRKPFYTWVAYAADAETSFDTLSPWLCARRELRARQIFGTRSLKSAWDHFHGKMAL